MALRQIATILRAPKATQVTPIAYYYATKAIGKREVVGYGWNGSPTYDDTLTFPMPPVRFKEDTKEILALREKEKCDWHQLSIDEKKALYRASFCQTFAEMKAQTGAWKLYLSVGIYAIIIGIWMQLWYEKNLYNELPVTFDEEHQKAQLRRMIDLEIEPVLGLTSKWDYEKNKWK